MTNASIILTDFPKSQHIKMNLRGCETEYLEKALEQANRLMMSTIDVSAGGYDMSANIRDVEAELEWRKPPAPHD